MENIIALAFLFGVSGFIISSLVSYKNRDKKFPSTTIFDKKPPNTFFIDRFVDDFDTKPSKKRKDKDKDKEFA